MTILAWNCRGIGSALAVRNLADEVRLKDPLLVFLSETKTGESKMKGVRNKLEYTQGITVPSDGLSGGLAMMWKSIRARLRGRGELPVSMGIPIQVNVLSRGNCWIFLKISILCLG